MSRWLVRFTLGAGLWLLAWPALAAERPADSAGRKEFPLKYRMTVNITEEVGYTGQYLQPTNIKPRLKEEPKYQSREPLYATVRLGAKREPYTLVLDSSTGGNRGYDILYVDADRDGRITAEEKLTGMPRNFGTTFGPVKITIDCGDEKCPQWFLVALNENEYQNQVHRSLQVMNAGYYQGVVTFGDQKRLVAFVDADCNGLYNDYMKGAEAGGDRLLIDLNGDGKLDGSDQSEEAQPLGRYVQVGDRYWVLDVAADGSSVTVQPLNKPLGTIRAEATDYTLLLSGDEGVLRVRSKDGTARVPAGKYRLAQCKFQVTDKGKAWEFSGQAHNGKPVEVVAGSEVKVPFGTPLVPKVLISSGGGQLSLNLALQGAGGETYNDVHLPNYERPPVPKARILDAKGRELAMLDFHYG